MGSQDLAARSKKLRDIVDTFKKTTDIIHTMSVASAVARAQGGDEVAFAWLYDYYKASVGKHLYYFVNDREVANDLYQDTFIAVIKQFKKNVPIPDFQRWLYRVASNLAVDYLRRKKLLEFVPLPENETDDPEEYMLSGLLSEEGHEDRTCEADSIRQALAQMSPQYRICVLLQELGGYSQNEIANMLGITEKAVGSNVSRGRQQLRAAYLRVVEELTATTKKGGRTN